MPVCRPSLFYGIDRLRFVRPTLINDTLHVVTTVTGKQDRDERSGTVSVEVKTINQHGDPVLVATCVFLVARRGGQADGVEPSS